MAQRVIRERTKQRETLAFEMRCEGFTQTRIADELGITQSAVSLMLARVSGKAEAELATLAAQKKMEMMERLETVFTEAMNAWERSKRPKQRRGRRKRLTNGEDVTQVDERVEQRCGDPRFLDRAMNAMRAQRVLLGLECASPQPPQDNPQERLAHYQNLTVSLLFKLEAQFAELEMGQTPS